MINYFATITGFLSPNALGFSAPTSPPEDVMATAPSSTSISFTWSPPPTNSQNGVIREYRINITEVETGTVFYHTATTTSITISSLHPYYTYNCTITAYTVATGPYTEVVTVRTLEDGTDLRNVTFHMNTHLHVWFCFSYST